jgi:hypothetical protein
VYRTPASQSCTKSQSDPVKMAPDSPVVVNSDAVLFLIDSTASPLRSDDSGLALPSWFFPLTDSEAIAAYVAELTAKELAEWEAQVANADGLKNSERAPDLLRARRAAS